MYKYFTNYTMILQTWSIWVSMQASNDKEFSNDLSKMAKHHFLYTTCIIFNFCVVSLYWTFIHTEMVKKYEHKPVIVMQLYLAHIQPGVVCLINSYMTNCVMSTSLIKPGIVACISYNCLNFVQTKFIGKPVYTFMPWTSYETPMLMSGLMVVFAMVFIVFCKTDEYFKLPINKKIKMKKN